MDPQDQDQDNDGLPKTNNEPMPISEAIQESLSRLAGSCLSDDELNRLAEQHRIDQLNQRINELLGILVADAGERRAKESYYKTFKIQTEYQRKVVVKVQEWASGWLERKKNCEPLVLYGPVGTGKDHLAFAAARQVVIQHQAAVTWLNGRDLAGKARDAISEESGERWFIQYAQAQLLVLSDPLPAIGELTSYQADCIYRLFERRDNRGLPTITTINVADDSEADRRLGAATWDRICHRAWKIACRWPSHRAPSFELKPD